MAKATQIFVACQVEEYKQICDVLLTGDDIIINAQVMNQEESIKLMGKLSETCRKLGYTISIIKPQIFSLKQPEVE